MLFFHFQEIVESYLSIYLTHFFLKKLYFENSLTNKNKSSEM